MKKGVFLKEDAREEFSLASGHVSRQVTICNKGGKSPLYRLLQIKPVKELGISGRIRAITWHRHKLETRVFSVCGTIDEESLLLRPMLNPSFKPGELVYFVPPTGQSKYSKIIVQDLKVTLPEEKFVLPKSVEKQVLVPPAEDCRQDDEWWEDQT